MKLHSILLIIVAGLLCSSCVNVYYKKPNPSDAPTTSLPPEMFGEYFANADDLLKIDESKIDFVYNHDTKESKLGQKYGPKTEYPIYKIDNQYMISAKHPEGSEHYRIFLFDYNSNLGQINVKELYGQQEKEEKKSLIEKIPSVKVLSSSVDDEYGVSDDKYLIDPSSAEFTRWIENNDFETVFIYQKKEFQCQRTEAILQHIIPGTEDWSRAELDDFSDKINAEIIKKINHYQRENQTGIYEFSIQNGSNSLPKWFRIIIVCKE